MKRAIAFIVGALILAFPHTVHSGVEQKIRQAGVAGDFYPADPKELTRMMDNLLAHTMVRRVQGPLVALVCPHAGYAFTGPVAAACFSQLTGRKYTRVIVIAPSHFTNFPFASIYDGDGYATPLGTVSVDRDFRTRLAKLDSNIKISDQGHTPVGKYSEHALEVELPWLQRTLGPFKLVPIIIGKQDYGVERSLGKALAKALRDEATESRAQTLILISSDLSHFHPYEYANNIDHQTLQAIENGDYLSLSRNFTMWEHGERTWEACGGAAIVAGMIAAEGLGATHAEVLKYANSGDTTSDKSNVVGYGAAAILRDAAASTRKNYDVSLTGSEKAALLKLARASVESVVRDHKILWVEPGKFPHLEEARGAFVTLTEKGKLRGCIGYISAMKSLAKTVRDVAGDAALEDSRFTPVTVKELPLLHYEISVLSPLRRVKDMQEITVGRHGLIVKRREDEGVLLPQVSMEEHWDRETFLAQACIKAGLSPQAWKDDGTDIFLFTALVFGDSTSDRRGRH